MRYTEEEIKDGVEEILGHLGKAQNSINTLESRRAIGKAKLKIAEAISLLEERYQGK